MPIAKQYKDSKTGEPWSTYYRYWCECTSITHVLELIIDHEDNTMEIGLSVLPQPTFLERLKIAWKVLWDKDATRLTEVIISKEDREELGAVIKGEVIE